MKNQMQYLALSILFISVGFQKTAAQCTPPMQENCDEANNVILCSLDEINGYSCANLSTIPSPCSPVCSQGGVGNNTSWWAFVTAGGNVTVTLTVGACTIGQGLEFGIWGDCQCGQEVACHSNPCAPPASVKTINANLVACKPYYLWVDGCNGDVCNFTLNTSGGGPPTLSPLGKINNDADMILDICAGSCPTFFVDAPSGSCLPKYEWTWNGIPISNQRSFETDITRVEGDYTLCVTAYLAFGPSGTICAQQGPQCATIKIRRGADKGGLPRVLCWEQANSGGYKWHSQKIVNNGIYREQFYDNTCCLFDSVVEFTVLESPLPANVYFITCDNKPYIDITGKKHQACLDGSKVILIKTTKTYKCDSSIVLTAVNVDFAPTWSTQCINGMAELIPNVNILKPCNAGETYQFEYKWFKKSDPAHLISTDERLLVKSVSEDYCLEVKVQTQLETETAVCTKTFCETFNEGNLAPECSFKLESSKVFCYDPIADYWLDSIGSPKVNSYTWIVTGGTLVSNPDSSSVKVKWALNPKDTGKVCATYNTDCGTSCQKCILVLFQTKIAGDDFDKRGLDAYLDAKPNPHGTWRLISGPYNVHILEPSNPRTRISAYNYGVYCFEWTINDPNCVIKDTLCVNLHNFPTINPEYPKLLFYERAAMISDQDQFLSMIFTPNLIDNHGESYAIVDGNINSKINYRWFDIYGRVISHDDIFAESGIQRMKISSPVHEGMYFLAFEINGVSSVRKICVIK